MFVEVRDIKVGYCILDIQTEYGSCRINFEEINMNKLIKAKTIYKPLGTIYDLFIEIVSIQNPFNKILIEKEIEGDFYCSFNTSDEEKYYVSITDIALVWHKVKIPTFIDVDLIDKTKENLQLQLNKAIENEDFELANLLKDKINGTEK